VSPLLQRTSIPEHHESIRLRRSLRRPGWVVSALAIVAGLLLAAVGKGAGAEVAGPVVAALGGIVLAALWQFRRFETTVGTVRIDLGTGPFRDTLATGAVESVARRPATGWRRAFADEELLLRVPFGRKREYVLPSRDPEAIERALAGRRDD
jgi:hypothetical protein